MASPTTQESLWLRRYHPRQAAEVTLVCLPHAGGAASFWFPFSELLPPEVEVLAVQYPGRQDRRLDPRIENVQEMARGVFDALGERARERPLALFGHSMGASVGFELIRLLEGELDVVPAVFFASGRPAPSVHRSIGVHLRDDAGIVEELRRISGTDGRVLDDPELLQLALPAIRSDYKAAETYEYRPGPPLRCDIIGLTGDADPRVEPDEVATWRDHTTGSFAFHVLPGDHFYLGGRKREVVDVVVDALRASGALSGPLPGGALTPPALRPDDTRSPFGDRKAV
ncbi:alpha/beta fold hydrolase [Streptomyces sp. CA-278952]|uniref:thioesterase II family protein n=1 Tax=unclassified Streptomyces TaxID=2593676 RepID=UPI002241BD83|nr:MULTISPECIES: alpha/beta fold hydrolase [unclassified Streptomyces]UZI32614.1 alpha/beta fold hydrolase [Streptomyces sp. VB1]WDG32549.1 alpha/beta fold hydrolase [Streptomyces sp. CA-278952]